jgi:hypothetical protein
MIPVRWSRRPYAASLLLPLVLSLLPMAASLPAPPAAAAVKGCDLMAHLKLPRPNPRNACQAIRRAQRRETFRPDSCLNFVAGMYGWESTGWRSPIGMWRNIRPRLRHPKGKNPPAGAIAIWKTSNPAGHVALVTRNGVTSTDVPRRGRVSNVPLHWITRNWDATYLGWVMPHFRGAS